jgi:hemerythrin-like domain-containing protein
MKATEILMYEHRVIEQVLDALEQATHRLANGEVIRPGFFIEACDFMTGFADGCHHRKEEGVLFPAMTAAGLPTEAGPIAVMLYEHDQGRTYTRAICHAARQLQAGETQARPTLVHNAHAYAGLLRQHIQKEDHILFPMADNVIPTPDHDRILADIERVERDDIGADVHQRYVTLAAQLVNEAQR